MNEKNVEHFALGIIVIILVYFFLEKKSSGHSATANINRGGASSGTGGGSDCGGRSIIPGSTSNKNISGSNGPQSPIPIGFNPLDPGTAYEGYQATGFQF